MTDFVVEVKDLAKTYRVGFALNKRLKAVDGVSFHVPRGKVFGLVGPNGAGKSTTIKVLLNLVKPTSGEVRMFGKPPSDASSRRELGYVPENPAPYPHLTAKEFVTMSGQLAGLSGKALDERVKAVLGQVGMSKAMGLQIRRMSKGMVQRVALAQALVAQPKLLILDEPTSGLDPLGRREFRDLLLQQRDEGVTIVFCTHIIPDVESLCDELALIVAGKVQRSGDLQTILSAGSTLTEIDVSGLDAESVAGFGIATPVVKRLKDGVLVHVDTGESGPFLQKALAAGAKIQRVQQVRKGLEELFVETVERSGQRVGSEIR